MQEAFFARFRLWHKIYLVNYKYLPLFQIFVFVFFCLGILILISTFVTDVIYNVK